MKQHTDIHQHIERTLSVYNHITPFIMASSFIALSACMSYLFATSFRIVVFTCVSESVDVLVVLEAKDRVGGRVYNRRFKNGGVTEVEVEFIGPTQDEVLEIISDVGLETFDTYNTSRSVL